MDVLKGVLIPIVGEECSITLLKLSPDLIQSPCFSLLVSKGLGIGIIVGGAVVKVPQIIKIVGAASAEGVSLLSYALETLAILIALAYNYRGGNPFSTYGETQAALFALLSPALVSNATLVLLQWLSIFIGSASKIPQIISNFLSGSTGQLSGISLGLQFVGSAARVFTTMREISDSVLIMGSIVAASLNGILFAQVLTSSPPKVEKKKKE
ncbi:hypothetical protein HDU96_002224 [Phlyctochytrium bullatum]|nr:hypothetical protein HDU96_002224 [Phlyctochytrium bullatum]